MSAELAAAFSQVNDNLVSISDSLIDYNNKLSFFNDCLIVVIVLLGALLGAHIIRSLRR